MDGVEADALDSSRDKSQNQVSGESRSAVWMLELTKTKGVYIYEPAKVAKATAERPSKRRKVASTHNQEEQSLAQCFVPLLNGNESSESVQLRYDTYKKLWAEQENKIQAILEDVDAGVLTDVLSFVQSTSPQTYDPLPAEVHAETATD